MDRRTVLKGAAWSVPVIAAVAATPLAAASAQQIYPISCVYLDNHGHGGNTGNSWWFVTYSDGSERTLDNGTVMRDKRLKELCKK